MDNRAENDERAEPAAYEPPTIIDHGSLAELTLAAGGSYTDGSGLGGGGS